MKTIDKAMNLLNLFTTETPEFRLVDVSRASGLDKVTAMRVLNSLVAGGLLEQHPETPEVSFGNGDSAPGADTRDVVPDDLDAATDRGSV